MPNKLIHFAQWIWQDYTGAKWQEINKANTHAPTGDSSYCTVQGSDSKSYYRPKSLFYHYQISGIDSSKYKLNNVTFTLVLGRKCSNKVNPLPSIKCFVGDNNAPYKKEPICTVSTYTLKKLEYDFDTYIIEYKLSNVTIADLKNLIVEVDWKRSLIKGDSTVRVNRARVNVNYEEKTPKWSIYDYMAEDTFYTGESIDWKITAKNTGYKGDGEVDITLPSGVTLVSSRGEGSFNSSTKKWTFNAGKNETRSRYFKLKYTTVGNKNLVANNKKNPVNAKLTRTVSVIKAPPKPVAKEDTITYTFYDTFANEERQYFDVQINGVAKNHPSGTACYPISVSSNVTLYTPLVYDNVYLMSESSDTVYSITGSYNDKICLSVEPNEDFEAHLRIFMKCDDTMDYGTVDMNANGTIFTGEFPILPPRKNIFIIDSTESTSRDKTYVVNSINVGATDSWTIRSKMSRHNFFDDKKDLMEIEIEEQIAYIGVVPLSRCHKADVTASSTNSLIENRYLNRAYYGKKGDYSEDIKMTLRIAWYDVATLQGLCEMDKPIPIDTIPHFPDGDPLNHRGWAEIYEVTNIKKINDLYYECDVGVKYLSHDILTRFTIAEAKKITEANIKYYLALIHNYNEDLLDIFTLNYYEFWTTLEDSNGDMIGSYDIDPQTSLIMNRDLNHFSTYDIVYRNSLPQLMSEDYDGNWEMALRVINKADDTTLFEHSYSNFKHYDFDSEYAINTADATSKYLNGTNYETLNFEKVGLGYDNLAPLIEDRKIATHFNTMENTIIDDPSEQFEIFLLDADNKGIPNQVVNVKIQDTDNFVDYFNVISDRYGRILFSVVWGNGDYTITLTYDENEEYRGCSYSTHMNVDFDYVEYHFEYQKGVTVYGSSYDYTLELLDANDDGVSGATLHYSFKRVNGAYGHEETVTTDSNGVAIIPIKRPNGSQMLKVAFKGYSSGGTIYQPVFFEEQVDVLNTGQDPVIEADDVEFTQGDNELNYNVILKSNTGVPLPQMELTFYFYNNDENLKVKTMTNDYGVATVPLYLKGGAYKVDVVFDGVSILNPLVETRNVIVNNFEQLDSLLFSDNLVLNETQILNGSQDFYTLSLFDVNDEPIADEPVSILIQDSGMETTYVDTIMRTDVDGLIKVPFITHAESVMISATYNGSVKYKAVENVDLVTFENIGVRYEQTLEKATRKQTDPYDHTEKDEDYLVLKKNSVVQSNWLSDDCIVIFEDNNRITSDFPRAEDILDGDFCSNEALPMGTVKVTVLVKGDSNYYSICRTFTLTRIRDSRPSFMYWCTHQVLDDDYFILSHEVLTDGDNYVGDYAHIRFKFNGWIPTDTPITCYSGYVNYDNYGTVYNTIAKDGYDEDGRLITYFDVYGVYTSEATWRFEFENTILCKWFNYEYELPVGTASKRAITVSQDGFAYGNETYQNIAVSIADSTTSTRTIQYNQGFYIIKCYNLETYEELYFYSYITDNLQASLINFMLTTAIKDTGDNWQIEIFVNDDDVYKCGYYTTTGRIDTQTIIEPTGLSIILQEENWIDIGDTPLEFDEEEGTISTDFNDYGYNEFMNIEYTNSNYHVLSFKQDLHGYNNYIIIGHDPTLTTNDGIYVGYYDTILYVDGELADKVTYDGAYVQGVNTIKVIRDGVTVRILVNDVEVYVTNQVSWNTFGIRQWEIQTDAVYKDFKLLPLTATEITPSVEEYDGSVFGSNIHLEIRDDKLNLIDYGMLPQGAMGSGNVILNDVPLGKVDKYALQLEIKYNNIRFERLNNLTGQMQMRVYEDVSTSELSKEYSKTLCSPMPVPNSKTVFTRHSNEGILYFVQDPLNANPYYLSNAYNLYKGGVQLYTETGISLFNLDNAYSPIYVGNELVRAEFHRRSGYIKLSRYDELSDAWYVVNILKLKKYPQLVLNEYNDDYAEIQFGQTIWKFYRGRPFIVVNHEKDDLRVLDIVDRVYCETFENEMSMGFIEEINTKSRDTYTDENNDEIASYSTFTPQLSIQQFKQELHIGQNIKVDNFKLYAVNGNGYVDDLENEDDATLGIERVDNDNALAVFKNINGKVGLNFPSYSNYVKRVGDTFTLSIDYVDSTESSMTVKARGFDERGAVPVTDGIQYGIWEQSHNVNVDTQETDEIRVTFTDCPDEVKYLDFIITFNSNSNSTVILKDFMYYEGDSIINHDVDTSLLYAEQVEVRFNETYYANLYNENDSYGLCIIRPSQHAFSLKSIYADKETVFVPYMKKCTEWDKPSQIFLEYLNAKRQVIDIDWSN